MWWGEEASLFPHIPFVLLHRQRSIQMIISMWYSLNMHQPCQPSPPVCIDTHLHSFDLFSRFIFSWACGCVCSREREEGGERGTAQKAFMCVLASWLTVFQGNTYNCYMQYNQINYACINMIANVIMLWLWDTSTVHVVFVYIICLISFVLKIAIPPFYKYTVLLRKAIVSL